MAQRVPVPGFRGPTNQLSAQLIDPERTINIFQENTAPGVTRVPQAFVGTPGLRPWTVLGAAPVRALFQQDRRAWAVGGGNVFEIFNPPSSALRASIASDEYLASICSNGTAGNQLLIVSGLHAYVYDLGANTVNGIDTGDLPKPRMCDFMDGYGIVSQWESRTFQISALEDFSSWDALDVFERSEGSDNIQSLIRKNREVWVLGTKTSEVWYDSGDALTPFQPIQGTFIEHGSAAPFSVQRFGNTLAWLSQAETGQGEVVLANGYQPQQVTSYAIANFIKSGALAADGDLRLAKGWSYQEDGHSFYLLVLPSATASYGFDITMPGLWHERARWTGSNYIAHVVQTHMAFAGRHLVGDRFSGAIYDQSRSYFNEQIVSP